MQINRCFELTYLLLEKGRMTAGQLAEHFEVSSRTIYRDIDTLSLAGIPIYCTKGRNGGIQLMDEFVMNKSLLSEKERNEIMFGLQSLQAAKYPELEELQSKMAGLFGDNQQSFVEIDFGGWDKSRQHIFARLRKAMTESTKVEFEYSGASGEVSFRKVEPIKLIFIDHAWYLQAFCDKRKDFRMFKLFRINKIKETNETFEPKQWPQECLEEADQPWITVQLWIDARMAFRVYDEFEPGSISKDEQGNFLAEVSFPVDDNWIYSYVSSFGVFAKIISPTQIREKYIERCESILKLYK